MQTPLFDCLKRLAGEDAVRLCTPGHAGGDYPFGGLERAFPLDLTELSETDDLYHPRPDGPILSAERLAARAFGAAHTLFCAGGASQAVQAMLAAAVPPGGTLALDRRCHISVLRAMVTLDLRPLWLLPESDQGDIPPEELAAAVGRADAALVTSPTYYGRVAPLEAYAAACRAAGKPLLVDNAHGAHLAFAFGGALHPIRRGARLCVDSAHKTLPVLTGGALLHAAGADEDMALLREKLAFFGSTSPSFAILASLDLARAWMEERGEEELRRSLACSRTLRARFAADDRLQALGAPVGDIERLPADFSGFDPFRLTLDLGGYAPAAPALLAALGRAHILPELFDGRYLVLLLHPAAAERAGKLADVLLAALPEKTAPAPEETPLPPPAVCVTPREAYLAPCRAVPAAEAAGRIAARPVYTSPPCIPLLWPGERIAPAHTKRLLQMNISSVFTLF